MFEAFKRAFYIYLINELSRVSQETDEDYFEVQELSDPLIRYVGIKVYEK